MNPNPTLQLLQPQRRQLVLAAQHRAHELRAEAEQAFLVAIGRSLRRVAQRAWSALRGTPLSLRS